MVNVYNSIKDFSGSGGQSAGANAQVSMHNLHQEIRMLAFMPFYPIIISNFADALNLMSVEDHTDFTNKLAEKGIVDLEAEYQMTLDALAEFDNNPTLETFHAMSRKLLHRWMWPVGQFGYDEAHTAPGVARSKMTVFQSALTAAPCCLVQMGLRSDGVIDIYMADTAQIFVAKKDARGGIQYLMRVQDAEGNIASFGSVAPSVSVFEIKPIPTHPSSGPNAAEWLEHARQHAFGGCNQT